MIPFTVLKRVPVTTYGYESWTEKRLIRKMLIQLQYGVGGQALWRPWTTRKMKKWVLEQIKSETSLEAKITKLKWFCLGHVMRRPGSLEKTIMLGN